MNPLLDLQKKSEKRGLALGRSDIKNDTIDFRFRDEVFTFPAIEVSKIVKRNGTFFQAKVDDLRKLARG